MLFTSEIIVEIVVKVILYCLEILHTVHLLQCEPATLNSLLVGHIVRHYVKLAVGAYCQLGTGTTSTFALLHYFGHQLI